MPKISVVIPTLNRAPLLSRTLDRLVAQDVDRDTYEVIVIDNGSTDDTAALLDQRSGPDSNIRRGFQAKPGAAATRNEGVRLARGEIVLFIDDDILAQPDLISAHLEYQRKHSDTAIIGEVVSPWSDRHEPFLRYLRDRGIFNPYTMTNGPMDFSFYHTGNVSTPRQLLDAVGGFNEDFFVYGMEDIELGYRLERAGCRMVHGPAARGVHHYFPTYEQFIQRCEQAGYSLGKMLELHPELRRRFVENGRNTRMLKKVHFLYHLFELASTPLARVLVAYEQRRGTGSVGWTLDRHYYWSVRYHFFLGFSEYNRGARRDRAGRNAESGLDRQRIPKLALENRSKVSSGPIIP